MAKERAELKKGKKRKVEEVEEVETKEEIVTEYSESEDIDETEESTSESELEAENPQDKKPEPQPRQDRFREYYMKMLTEEFGDDLDALRKDKNFDEKQSLPILIRSLEQGMNIFSEEERKLILEQL